MFLVSISLDEYLSTHPAKYWPKSAKKKVKMANYQNIDKAILTSRETPPQLVLLPKTVCFSVFKKCEHPKPVCGDFSVCFQVKFLFSKLKCPDWDILLKSMVLSQFETFTHWNRREKYFLFTKNKKDTFLGVLRQVCSH